MKLAQNKGQIAISAVLTVGLVLAIALALFVLLGGISVVISILLNYAIIIAGIAFVVFGGIIAIKGNLDRTRKNVVAIFVLIGMILILGYSFGAFENTALDTGQYIQTPLWGYYQCDYATSALTEQFSTNGVINYGAADKIYSYQCPSNTDTCVISISNPSNVGTATLAAITWSSPQSSGQTLYTGSIVGKTVPAIPLTKGQVLKVSYIANTPIGTPNAGQVTVKYTFKPLTLWRYDPTGGGLSNVGTDLKHGCTFNAGESAKLIISDTLGIGTGTAGTKDTLNYRETRNFIANIIPISVENSKFQNNGAVYCMSNEKRLYPVKTITTPLYTYKVVDTNNPGATVQCCNGDVTKTTQCVNNKYVAISSGQATPDFTGNCPGVGTYIVDSTNLGTQTNVNGVCTTKLTQVECTDNSACKDSTKPVCDLPTYKCVATGSDIGVPIKINTTITSETACQAKALTSPFLGYTWVKTQTETRAWYTLGFGKPNVTTSGYCEASFVKYYIMGGTLVVIVIVVMLFLKGNNKRKK